MTRTTARRISPPPPARAAAAAGERGFTFVEAMVALLISIEVIVAGLALFDFHNKLARVQAQVSDMQQSLRIAQYEMVHLAREAGRGGFPAVLQPGTINESWGAVAVRNNVTPANDQVAIGFSGSPKAMDNTDILTLRGVFSSPIFEINKAAASLVLSPAGSTPANATAGTVVVCATTSTLTPQDLSPLINAVKAAATAGQVEPLILVGPQDSVYGVVELNTAGSDVVSNQPLCPSPAGVANPNGVKIAFNITGDATANAFQKLSATSSAAGLPPGMSSVGWLGVLEEYRYYVRQDYTVPGDTTSDPAPHLSRARMYPGTETPYYNDATNLQVDVADNVLDLQVALGVDANGDGLVTEGSLAPPNPAPSTTDEWIFNIAGDVQFPPTPQVPPPLREVRISTLVKTGRSDDRYQGPTLTNIEDHKYLATDFPNTFRGRTYRHRLLQTVVGLRNL
jgi:Tfp pilus assembly protein FimT